MTTKELRPQTQAKKNAVALIQAARDAGWRRAKFEIRPDGSVTVDAGMAEIEGGDEFLDSDLRMGK